MESTPSEASIDSGYITGGHLDGPGSDGTKDIAPWIAPWIHQTIRRLCNKLGAPAAAPHILAGVTTILTQPSPSSNNAEENQKIPALIAAVYLSVCTRLSQRDTCGEEYVSQRKEILSTLGKLREDETRYVTY